MCTMMGHPPTESHGNHYPPADGTTATPDAHRALNLQPSIRARLTARLRQGRFDRLLAVGCPAAVGSALFVHAERIVAFPEREAIARALRLAVAAAHWPPPNVMSGRVPIHRDNVAAAEATIDALTLRLHAPMPVNARGMARLRLVMSDGTGPFYQHGRGDLDGRLGAARAAL